MFSFKAWMVLCGCCLLYKCLCEVKNREKIIKSRITDNSNSIIRIGKFIGYFLAKKSCLKLISSYICERLTESIKNKENTKNI